MEELASLESINACQVCGSDKKLCIDHDHESGRVRGVLCDNCNKALGHAKDDIETLKGLVSYLENFSYSPVGVDV